MSKPHLAAVVAPGEKRKRVRPAAVKRDPVIAALIAKLPPEGADFDRARRVNWLRQIAMAFDGAYGVQLEIFIDVDAPLVVSGKDLVTDLPNPLRPHAPGTAPTTSLRLAAEPDEIRYFIDPEGFARMEPGNKRVRPVDVPNGAEIEDERDGDDSLDTIKWSDGQWPPAAYPDRSFVFTKA